MSSADIISDGDLATAAMVLVSGIVLDEPDGFQELAEDLFVRCESLGVRPPLVMYTEETGASIEAVELTEDDARRVVDELTERFGL